MNISLDKFLDRRNPSSWLVVENTSGNIVAEDPTGLNNFSGTVAAFNNSFLGLPSSVPHSLNPEELEVTQAEFNSLVSSNSFIDSTNLILNVDGTRYIYNGTVYRDWETDRKSTRLNSSHRSLSRMPSSA